MRFFKDYTAEFKSLQKEIGRLGKEQDSQYQQLVAIEKKQEELSDKLDKIIGLLTPEPKKAAEIPIAKARWDIPKTGQRPYKKLIYIDWEFYSPNNHEKKFFDISDVYKLSKFVEDKSVKTKSELHEIVAPDMSRSAFIRMLYNYQGGYFDEYLSDYQELEFGVEDNHIVINDVKTSLTLKDTKEIILIISNAKDFYDCVNGLTNSYNSERVKWVKIIADNYNNPKLSKCLKVKKVKIVENNPQKRKEKGLK